MQTAPVPFGTPLSFLVRETPDKNRVQDKVGTFSPVFFWLGGNPPPKNRVQEKVGTTYSNLFTGPSQIAMACLEALVFVGSFSELLNGS